MPTLDPKPEFIRPGQKQISAEAINKIIRATSRQLYGSGSNVVDFFGDRPVISGKDSKIVAGIDNYVKQFMVLGETDDYLICTQYTPPSDSRGPIPQVYSSAAGDPDSSTQNPGRVYVAKPYALQRAPWDGIPLPALKLSDGEVIESNTYTYGGIPLLPDGTPEQGFIGVRLGSATSPYLPINLQIILPSYIPGDLILATQAMSGLYDPNQNLINWMDVNLAGRSWQGNPTSITALNAEASVPGTPVGGYLNFADYVPSIGDPGNVSMGWSIKVVILGNQHYLNIAPSGVTTEGFTGTMIPGQTATIQNGLITNVS